jgi:3-hydroxybutyryl-CoA dehydrogenase
MYDLSEEAVKKGIEAIKKSVGKFVEKGKIKEDDAKAIEGRLIPIKGYDEAKDVDMVIEAVVEDINVKKKIFEELDAIMPDNVILASCTSALPITEIMSKTRKPHRTIGTHFHHPPVLMRLVEVVHGYLTSEETVESVIKFLTKVGKIPVPCKDYPGFVTSRVGIIMINEGIKCLAEGVSTPENIDKACVAGFNWPMGPLKLADLIGLDTCLYVLDDLAQKLGPGFLPSPLLRQMVSAGHLGVKTGKGFFDYSKK